MGTKVFKCASDKDLKCRLSWITETQPQGQHAWHCKSS